MKAAKHKTTTEYYIQNGWNPYSIIVEQISMYKHLYRIFCVTALLALINSCNQEEAAESEENSGPIKVNGTLVKAEAFTQTITSTANLLPYEQVELKAPVAGNVMAIYFEEGEEVRKGERLIRIDDRDWRAQLQGLQAQLTTAESTQRRNRQLMEREGISEQELEQSEAAVKNLQARAQELQVMINLANVSAPISGVVGMRDFSLGDYLTQGQTITQLVQKDKLRVDFSLPAEYAPFVEEGQEVKVIASATGDTASAEIYAINPVINLNSRQIQLRANLNNEEGKFIPGDFAEIELTIRQDEDAIMVPAESVMAEANSHVVFKVEKGKALKQNVALGIRTTSEIQILDGLAEGDTILLTGLMQVEDSSAVQVEELKQKAL